LVDRETFDRRLARLEEMLSELRRIGAEGEEAFLSDARLRAATERWLQVAAECAIDLANQVIADRGWRTPDTYRDAFRILLAQGAITQETCRALEGWAGLRNVLVHLYTQVRETLLWKAVSEELDQLERFVVELTRFLGQPAR
jgi:uncharacterized protein YutE (UPF0331/DUF86 family)